MDSDLRTQFPQLRPMDDVLRDETEAVRLSSGEFICMDGNACHHLALVTGGTARVYKSGGGREITLYRVEPGESCILTTSCIMSDRRFPAFAVAETDVEARLVPAATVRRWMEVHAAWRRHVFDLLSGRLDAVIAMLEEVTFRKLDARLAALLLERGAEAGTVRATHDGLASDLGSAREVVSRLLKELERDGMVDLGRGRVDLADTDRLRQMAGPAPGR